MTTVVVGRAEREPRLRVTGRYDVVRPVTPRELQAAGHIVGVPVGLRDEADLRAAALDQLLDPVDVAGRVDDSGLAVRDGDVAAVAQTGRLQGRDLHALTSRHAKCGLTNIT